MMVSRYSYQVSSHSHKEVKQVFNPILLAEHSYFRCKIRIETLDDVTKFLRRIAKRILSNNPTSYCSIKFDHTHPRLRVELYMWNSRMGQEFALIICYTFCRPKPSFILLKSPISPLNCMRGRKWPVLKRFQGALLSITDVEDAILG